MPKVSVIIPSFNNASYIIDSVESVLNQTLKDVEIIVVDDGSKDNTRAVLGPYIEKDLIKYIYQENKGPGAARNRGITSASGDYIAFLDSDDIFTQDSLQRRIALIESDHDLGLVFSDLILQVKGQEAALVQRKFPKNISRYMVRTDYGIVFDGPFGEIAELFAKISTITVLVKKEVFEKVGYFRTDIIRAEDIDMWLRIMTNYKIGYVDSPLATYNHFRGSLTSSDPLRHCQERFTFFNALLKVYPNEKGIIRAIHESLALTYCTLGHYYFEKKFRMKFITNYLKSFYYKPFGETYRYQFLIFSFVPQRLKGLLKILSKSFISKSGITGSSKH